MARSKSRFSSPQATIAAQLDLGTHGVRTVFRLHADAAMTAAYKRANPKSRIRSIVKQNKVEHSHQWFSCVMCGTTSPQWSSATNPSPKWARQWAEFHVVTHADAWLAERGYVVPGEDSAVDCVLGDALVEAFGRLTVVTTDGAA